MGAMKKVFLFLLMLLQLLALSASAATHDYIGERAYFEDASNTLTLDGVKNKPFVPFSGMLSKGYSKSAFWVRLKISPTEQSGVTSPLVLKIQPTYLDEIRLYDAAEPLRLNRVVGDRYPYANNERKSLTYDFLIPARSEPRYVWLRLKTSSTNLIQISVVQAPGALDTDRLLEAVSTSIFSVLVVFLIWAFLQWWITRERLVGVFLIRQLLGIAFFVSYVGYSRILLEGLVAPQTLDLALSFFVLSSTTAALWFHGEFFKDYLIHRWLQGAFTGMVLLFPLEMLLFASGMLSKALEINMIVVMLSPLFMLIVSIFAIPWNKLRDSVSVLPRRYLILAHAIYLALTTTTALPSLGLTPGNILSPHAVLFHALVTAIVLVMVILYRAKRIEEKRVIDVAVAQQNAYNERLKREEQAHFLEMLTHEFKTSLAVLKMALGSVDLASKEGKYANRAIDSMNEVIERCAQVQALSDNQVQVEFDEIDLVELLRGMVLATHASERINLEYKQPVKVKTDEKLLRVIFANLIDNALKYSKPQSIVNISVIASVGDVIVNVSNVAGSAGMPDANRVFSKYYRSERAHEQVGSGLGLYLTWQFANMLGMQLRYAPKSNLVEFELCLKQSA